MTTAGKDPLPSRWRDAVGIALWRFVRRLTWKRELARVDSQNRLLRHRIQESKNWGESANRCYHENLKTLREANAEAGRWREKYHEARRYLRAANKGARVNALVAQLATARLHNAIHTPPNTQSSATPNNGH